MPLFSFQLFRPAPIQDLIRRGDLVGLNRLATKEGVDTLNARIDKDQNTPLIFASSKGAYRVVDWLVSQAGVELNARNRFGWTAVYEAAGTGHRHVLERLLQAGSDPRIGAASWPRQSPAQMAKQMGWHACAEVLVEAERSLKASQTPLPTIPPAGGIEGFNKRAGGGLPPASTSATTTASPSTTPASSEGEETKERDEEGGEGEGEEEEMSAAEAVLSSSTSTTTADRKMSADSSAKVEGQKQDPFSTFTTSTSSSVTEAIKKEEGEGGEERQKGEGEEEAGEASSQTKKELPACLRWQVEAGVGEWSNQRLAWDDDFDLLEVHPVVWSKRGPRVGRHRQEGKRSGTAVVMNQLNRLRKAGVRSFRAPLPVSRRKQPRWIAQN